LIHHLAPAASGPHPSSGNAPATTEETTMLRTIAAFDRIGEENAFAVLARATKLAAQGRDIINLGIGQPDFRTPEHIVEAAVKALRDGHHGYTPANGIVAVREAVAADLHKRFGVTVSADEVMIMPGSRRRRRFR
jgi:aspartate/methionine/tyrosine aminotransferase